jgi:hypothetical protein
MYATDADGYYVLDFRPEPYSDAISERHAIRRWVFESYDGLWETGREMDEDEKIAQAKVDAADPASLLGAVCKCIQTINRSDHTEDYWKAYLSDLREQEEEWGVKLFTFDPDSRACRLNVMWDKLAGLEGKEMCRACYMIDLALYNAWFGERLPSALDVLYSVD